MTRNPYLNRLLGETAREAAQVELDAPPGTAPSPEAPPKPVSRELGGPGAPDTSPDGEPEIDPAAITPTTQQLVRQWQGGDHMAVATALMFTAASYLDFVNLVYIIGKKGALELGQLLDELADSSNEQPPETPPQYNSLVNRVAGEEEGVL